jgi:hypothetical protein
MLQCKKLLLIELAEHYGPPASALYWKQGQAGGCRRAAYSD